MLKVILNLEVWLKKFQRRILVWVLETVLVTLVKNVTAFLPCPRHLPEAK